jgi:PhoH-like ATPase
MKTILTRAGEGSKIILTGDCSQIDTHQLDAINNGLTYVVEKFKEYDLAGHITFTQGERSALATLASEIL